MKKYISIIVLLGLFVIGCSEQTSINSPVNDLNINEPNWIALPQAEGMQVNTDYTVSGQWDGKKAGTIVSISKSYSGGLFGTVVFTASLSCDRNSFVGIKTISMTLSSFSIVATFGPAQSFNLPLKYNYTLTGLDLRWLNPANIKFVYLAADGTYQVAQHEGIFIDPVTGTLSVKNAKIPHFSRYGFVN